MKYSARLYIFSIIAVIFSYQNLFSPKKFDEARRPSLINAQIFSNEMLNEIREQKEKSAMASTSYQSQNPRKTATKKQYLYRTQTDLNDDKTENYLNGYQKDLEEDSNNIQVRAQIFTPEAYKEMLKQAKKNKNKDFINQRLTQDIIDKAKNEYDSNPSTLATKRLTPRKRNFFERNKEEEPLQQEETTKTLSTKKTPPRLSGEELEIIRQEYLSSQKQYSPRTRKNSVSSKYN